MSQTSHPLIDLIKALHDQQLPPPISYPIALIGISKMKSKNRTTLDHCNFVHQSSSPWQTKHTTRLPSLYLETTQKFSSFGHVRVLSAISSNTSPAPSPEATVEHCGRQCRATLRPPPCSPRTPLSFGHDALVPCPLHRPPRHGRTEQNTPFPPLVPRRVTRAPRAAPRCPRRRHEHTATSHAPRERNGSFKPPC